MSKVVIIGIDGFDPILLRKWKDILPNFSNLYSNDSEISIKSTFPPDSICAWASIFTGDNPGEHGFLESVDYLSTKRSEGREERAAYFKGRTFWDMAGKKGKDVCVINPFIAYPAWEVNGVMVSGPVFEGGNISAYPVGFLKKYHFPPIGGIVDLPDEKDLEGFLAQAKKMTEELADVSLRIYRDRNPDLFFISFLTLDRIKHFLWRFGDEEDIYYPGENPFKDAIKEFYILYDSIVGRFMETLPDKTTLIIISDHGHGRRCWKSLNLNEVLRTKGYLAMSGGGARGLPKRVIEKTKHFTIAALTKCGLHDWIYKIARLIPNRRALKKGTYLIDAGKSRAKMSDIFMNNPCGGIDIHAATEEEYDKLREEIINELLSINDTYGEHIVKWAKKREDVYRGKCEKRLPDVLFELEEKYGTGTNLFTSPISPNYARMKFSGGHKNDAVLLVCSQNGDVLALDRPASIIEFKDYIQEILDC